MEICDSLTTILTCQNRPENLAYCLASINACTPTPRCILVDFGSTVSLKHYENKYKKWLKVIRIETNEMFHKTRALNIGIRAAKTEYVCLTDVDQIFQPNFFNMFLENISKNAFIRCTTQFSKHVPAFKPANINYVTYRTLLSLVKKDPQKKPHGEGCCHGIQRQWLLDVRGHDEGYIGWGYEDKDLDYRARLARFQPVWIDNSTSMIHLPHKRNFYFDPKFRNANKNRFERRKQTNEIVVNKGSAWGVR